MTADIYSDLDTGQSWYLERLEYHDHLVIELVEGVRSAGKEPVRIGDVSLGDGYRIETSSASRNARVVFECVVMYQVTEESFAKPAPADVEGGKFLRSYSESELLDYAHQTTTITELVDVAVTHYRLVLADDVIDVLSTEMPKVEVMKVPLSPG